VQLLAGKRSQTEKYKKPDCQDGDGGDAKRGRLPGKEHLGVENESSSWRRAVGTRGGRQGGGELQDGYVVGEGHKKGKGCGVLRFYGWVGKLGWPVGRGRRIIWGGLLL